MDKSSRSLIKTITWRVTGSGATFFIAWLISNDLSVSGTIAILQLITNTVLYYVHERIWNKISWGVDK